LNEWQENMRKRRLLILIATACLGVGLLLTVSQQRTAYAGEHPSLAIPKTYGKLVAAIPDSIGTGMVFEDPDGVIRFVSVTGMKEGELARFEGAPSHGGIPKSYGRLVTAVVNQGATGLVFEDAQGVIRLVTLTGEIEGEFKRN
jgi:hypothetical protein